MATTIGKKILESFNNLKGQTSNFLRVNPTPASYLQNKINPPVVSPLPTQAPRQQFQQLPTTPGGILRNTFSQPNMRSYAQNVGQMFNGWQQNPAQRFTSAIDNIPLARKNFQSPLPQITNPLLNTGQTVLSGMSDVVKGVQNTARGRIPQGAAQVGFGVGKTLAPFTGPAFQIANIATQNTYDPVKRIAKGFLQGQTGIDEIAPDVQAKNINVPVIGEIDPLMAAGSMYGFTKNPTWNKIFPVTSKLLNVPVNNPVVKFVVGRLSKGGLEGMIQGFAQLPQNAELKDYVGVVESAVFGAGSELASDTAMEGGKKVLGKIGENPAVKSLIYKIAEEWRKQNRPYSTTQVDPVTGKRIVIPLWQHTLFGGVNNRFASYIGAKAEGFPKDGQGTFSSMADKKVRFEIDDSKAKVKYVDHLDRPTGTVKLIDILDHKELYKQYPEYKDMNVTFNKSNFDNGVGVGEFGSYNPKTNTININASRAHYGPQDKSTLLHEIQHAIQEKEGFARGGSPDSMWAVLKKQAEELEAESKVLFNKTNKLSFEERKNNKDFKRAWELSNKARDLRSQSSGAQMGGFSPYQRLSGEVEARDVQSRMNLTPEQRRTTLPYQSQGIPVKDQIVRFDSGTQASVKNREYNKLTNDLIESYANGEAQIKKLEELQSVVDAQENPKRFRQIADEIAKIETGNRSAVKQLSEHHGISDYDALDALSTYIDAGTRRGKRTVEDFYKFLPESNIMASIDPQKATSTKSPEIKKLEQELNAMKPPRGEIDLTGFQVARKYEILEKINQLKSTGTQSPGLKPKVTTEGQSNLLNTQQGIKSPSSSAASQRPSGPQALRPEPQINQTASINSAQSQPLDDIIAEGRKQIKSGGGVEDKRPIRQVLSDAYTQWVDRYNPINQASQRAKKTLSQVKAELRPENDPEYLVRRLTGAGGIADTRFQKELKPVIDQLDKLKIDKLDFDTYLANKRMAGFGEAGRTVYGSDPVKSRQIIQAIETKYGPEVSQLADQLYSYQNKGFQEMIDAGFISPEAGKTIRQQNPDYSPLNRVMDEVSDYLGLPTRKTMQGSQPIKKIKGSTRDIESPLESIIGNTFTQRAAIEKNRVAKSIVDLQQIAPDLGFSKSKEAGPDTITVWRNGQKEYWNVGKDIAEVAKGVNEESMNMVLKVLQAPASLLRQGATGRNPEFMLPNIVRDQLDAGITSKYGYIPFVDYVSGLKSMLTNDSVYQKWQSSGAKIDLGEISGKKSISKMFTEKNSKKNLKDWIGAGLDVMGKYSEQPTRVGLFKKAYNATGNELKAVMESRDATVDFARMGSKMKVANSIIPFLNVGVQGFDKLIRSIKDNPGKVLFTAGVYGVAPQIASTLYNLQNHPEEYAEIPQYEKDSNFVLIKGRNEKGTVDYVTIPKGNIIPAIANPTQSFLEYVYGADGQSFGRMATSLLSDTLPGLAGGSTPKEVAIKAIGSNIPQAIKPAAETLLNKSFYKYDSKKEQSKDIVPSYLQKKPAYEQKYDFTPQMYQKIGAALNVSPLQVQNIAEGYLAGYAKIPAQIVEMMYKTSRGDEVNTNDKTLLRRFIKETYPSNPQPEQYKPEAPGFMERVFGKTNAADKPLTDEQKKQKDLYSRDKLRYSKDKILKENGKIYLKKDTESGVSIDSIDIKYTLPPPKLTGIKEIDKQKLSTYKSSITARIKDIGTLLDNEAISREDAVKELNQLLELRNKVTPPKKGKKLISDAELMSAYKKALEAAYAPPRRTSRSSQSLALPQVRLKRQQVRSLR